MANKVPKFSDRVNFLLKIHGQDIPRLKKVNFPSHLVKKILLAIDKSSRTDESILKKFSDAAEAGRLVNVSGELETSLELIQLLRSVYIQFFDYANVILSEGCVDLEVLVRDVYSLITKSVVSVNELIREMDGSWLRGYGSISHEFLKYPTFPQNDSPVNFLRDFFVIAPSIIPDAPPTIRKLRQLQTSIRLIHRSPISDNSTVRTNVKRLLNRFHP